MADQGFNKIFVLIAVVLLQTSPGSGDVFYYEVNSTNDFAIRIQHVVQDRDPYLVIFFYYNAESASATTFFGNKIISQQLRDASKCPGVLFNFNPCSVVQNNTPNNADMTHTCVVDTLPKQVDQISFMDFILCYFNTNKINQQYIDGCLKQINMEEKKDIIHKCVAKQDESSHATSDCRVYRDDFRIANDAKGNPIQAIENFQKELCKNVLGTGPLKCTAFCTKKY